MIKPCCFAQELASKGRMVEDVVGALRNEEAAKLAAQRDAQSARTRMHQLEVGTHCLSHGWLCRTYHIASA